LQEVRYLFFFLQEEEFEESEASESDFNPFGSDSESDLEDPWEKRGGGGKKGGGKRRGKPKAKKEKKADPFAHLVLGRKAGLEKNPGLKKNQPSGFFWYIFIFWVFFGFFWFFI
jgi:hypothetical protein